MKKEKKKTPEQIERTLAGFYGTDHYYEYGFVMLTDGVKWMVDNCGAYWLMDIINSIIHKPEIQREPFLHVRLIKGQGMHKNMANFLVDDGGKPGMGRQVIYTQLITFTDFPLEKIEFYICDNKIVLLKSEY